MGSGSSLKLANGFVVGNETKIFDPNDPSCKNGGAEVLDASVVRRGGQWWMYLGGQAHGYGATQLFSASLPAGAPLSVLGWTLTRDDAGELTPVATQDKSGVWDRSGGRHCPAYVRGFDPHSGQWVERIYYAGAAENIWGPYTIGYLEWVGGKWVDQAEPAFIANEEWERGSVFEPNVIYADGKWKMWYVAGSNAEDYLVHGFAESEDGRTGWSRHTIFAPPEMKMFDFCVRQRGDSYEAVFSRVWVAQAYPSPGTGLWWCSAKTPASTLAEWSDPVQIMHLEDRGWRIGPWKPALTYDDAQPNRCFVFFDGLYRTSDPGPFPFVFTLGCLELAKPDHG
jgi:hypothetical protein